MPNDYAASMRVPGREAPETVAMYARQEAFLNHRAMGMTVKEACAQPDVDIHIKTYEKWRSRFSAFRFASDEIKIAVERRRNDPLRGDDFAGFRLHYFKHQSPPFHLRIIHAIEKSKPGSVTMILVPPNHGKTTLLTDWICYKLAHDPNHCILYISESSKLATKVIGRVKRRMTDPNVARQYIADFGPFYQPGQEKQSKPWAAEQITVFKADHDEQDYSLESMGWGNQIYGVRSDTIVLDDYQTLKTAEKGTVTQAMVDKFQQDIYTRIDPDEGRIVIIGTRVAPLDFYVNLLDQGEVIDDVIIMPVFDWRGEPLWPARLDKPKLEKLQKKVGQKVWTRAYLMRPQEDGAATFTEAVMNDCKNMSLQVNSPPTSNEEVWAGLDPAIDKWTAMTAVAVSLDSFRLMSTYRRWEMSTGEAILALIKEVWLETHFTQLVVEAVSFQKALARDERLVAMKNELGFTIVEHQTNLNKSDETFGVARMASSYIDGSVQIPWADEKAVEMFTPFVNEHLLWRASIPTRLREQDQVMSTWFPWNRWQRFRAEHLNQTKSIRTQGMPFKPTQARKEVFQYHGSFLR